MPSHYRGSSDEVLALNTFIRLTRGLNTMLLRVVSPLQREHGVTESQFGVLEALYHLGPLSQGELCQKILRSGSNLTTVVDNLERVKLVRRERDTTDRRVQIVHLTEAGRKLLETILPEHVARITRVLGVLSAEEQAELGRLSRKLGTAPER